jgi:hypothetical protein
MTKKTYKSMVLEELERMSGSWITAGYITDTLNVTDPHVIRSTVSRALRKLRSEGKAISKRVSGDRWAHWASFNPSQIPVVSSSSMVHNFQVIYGGKSSKGSLGGTTMCIDLNKPTLNSAIEEVVKELITKKEKFSGHDVTKRLRDDLLLGGDPIIDDRETGVVFVKGKLVPKIEHDYVRDVVHELFHQGKMSGYDRTHNGQYWEYVESDTKDTSDDPLPDISTNGTNDDSYDGNPTI